MLFVSILHLSLSVWENGFLTVAVSGKYEFGGNEFNFAKNEFEKEREKIPSHYDSTP
jgi:hypothetical protein